MANKKDKPMRQTDNSITTDWNGLETYGEIQPAEPSVGIMRPYVETGSISIITPDGNEISDKLTDSAIDEVADILFEVWSDKCQKINEYWDD